MALAFVFPGQGSQAIGMLAAHATHSPLITDCFAEASDALNRDLWALVQDGPEAELAQTQWTQPALLAASVALYRLWLARGGPAPTCLAGHSLGEYSALTIAGVFSFADAVRLTALRGRLMQAAVPEGAGAMAAVMNADLSVIETACAEASALAPVQPANLNCPGQIVISGATAGVDRALDLLREAGVKRAIRLSVSVPSHSSLMRDAADELSAALETVAMQAPALPVLHNVDGLDRSEIAAIRAALAAQLYQPVRWIDCVDGLRTRGATQLVECGPGKVLCGLVRRIDAQLACFSLAEPEDLDRALEACA